MRHPLTLYTHLFTTSSLLALALTWHLSTLLSDHTQPRA